MMKRVMLGWAVTAAVFVAGCDVMTLDELFGKQADQPKTVEPAGNFTAEPNGAGVTITAYNGLAEEMVIPGTIDDLPVTVIGAGVFKDKSLTHLYIPHGVTSIGQQAFYGHQLTELYIPHGVTSIGSQAFYRDRLYRVTIGNGVTGIGGEAFSGKDFRAAYAEGGAGTYTSSDGGSTWS
jgi:hypothetical protein